MVVSKHIISKWCNLYYFKSTERPNVAFKLIRLILPNFRTSIIWSSSLSRSQLLFEQLRNIEICNFVDACIDEDVCTLQISVYNFEIVKNADPSHNLFHHSPNLLLINPCHSFFLFFYHFLYLQSNTSRSPPSANSITMHKVLDLWSKNASLYLMMLSELIEASKRT